MNDNRHLDSWFSKRKIGWEPLVVLLFIEFLFSRLTDNATFIEVLKSATHLEFTGLRLIFALFLVMPVILFWLLNKKALFRKFITVYVFVDTFRLLFAIFVLVQSIGEYTGVRGGDELFKDVIFIWFINVIVFGVWYWILDAGGPEKRNEGEGERRDFLFPQFGNEIKGWEKWHPDFVDYLFLAFNTSTTFGPTDTMVLSRRVKILMIIQVVASFTSFAVIAARAVTILK